MTDSPSPVRARAVAALAFGAAAGVFAAVAGVALWTLFGGLLSMPWIGALGLTLAWTMPSAAAGAAVGPALVRQARPHRAAGLGTLTTAAAAFVQMLGAFAVGAALSRSLTGESARVVSDPALWTYALALAVAMVPLGALAGWLVWRRAHRRPHRHEPDAL